MKKTREVTLICWQGRNTSRIEVISSKYPFNRRVIIAEMYSPVTISDGSGMEIKVHGDGKMRKNKPKEVLEANEDA